MNDRVASPHLETVGLTVVALVAFASNSILTRLALGRGHIDASSFTAFRLLAGAAVLAALVRAQNGGWAQLRPRGLPAPVALFAYAAPFSFAYQRIGAAVGALVLFGAVQLTMIGWGIANGERPAPRAWVGLSMAAPGLVALMLPSAGRPDVIGIALMVVAGAAWGAYSLQGRGGGDPLAANARGFVWSIPFALVLAGITMKTAAWSWRGLVLATLSGAVTSGLGYAVWYRALRGLSATQAAIVQLTVPVIASFGAVGFLHERPTARLVICGLAVLCGVGLALSGRRR